MQKLGNSKTKSVDWRKLLAFRETFEKKSFSTGKRVEEEGHLPFFLYSRSARMFIETAYEAGIIEKFDWPKWQSKAERLVLDPKALKSASLGTLRKLITTHVRKDRFCEGHLASMFENGHILAILRRAEALLDETNKPTERSAKRRVHNL